MLQLLVNQSNQSLLIKGVLSFWVSKLIFYKFKSFIVWFDKRTIHSIEKPLFYHFKALLSKCIEFQFAYSLVHLKIHPSFLLYYRLYCSRIESIRTFFIYYFLVKRLQVGGILEEIIVSIRANEPNYNA